jgi:hypothetical protein
LEVLFELVESCGKAPKLLEVREGPFDAVALAIECAVEVALNLAHGSGWDNGLDATFAEMVQDRVRIIALVGEHCFWPAVSKERDGLRAIMGLTSCQHEAERQAKSVGEQMDLGR